ncbi:MAG: 30S ribosomal protein S6 [Oscillospiraceae bacterium]|nr:30S ribosomal protein S6 [Oscillospiraceae bacterium]
MAKISGNYELVYILRPELSEEQTAELVTKFKSMAEEAGTVTEVDEWGKRRLAYPINDLNEGYYVRMTFSSVPEFPQKLERMLRITDGVMRSMTVCLDD